MSTLHEELLARIDRGDPHGLITAWKAVRAVVELHASRPCNCKQARHVICDGCPGHAVRCVTITAVARELGVEIGDTPK